MEALKIIDYIGEHGLAFVLSGVFIYIIIRCVNLLFTRLSTHVTNKQHDKLLEMRTEIDTEVYSIIREFITAHSGTRVQVIEFTNSVTSVAYLPFRYMTCTYEIVSYGSKPEAKRIDKLSTSLFSPLLSKLSKEGMILLDEEIAYELSGAVHDIFEGMGSKYELMHILKTQKNKSIGFVVLCKEDDVTHQDTSDIKTLASQLSALLGVLDN